MPFTSCGVRVHVARRGSEICCLPARSLPAVRASLYPLPRVAEEFLYVYSLPFHEDP